MIFNNKSLITIIGNGFDIAHGLNTKYDDFMEHIKNRLVTKHNQNVNITTLPSGILEYKELSPTETRHSPNVYIWQKNFKYEYKAHDGSFYLRTLFAEYNANNKWSDLESHFYKTLYNNRDVKLQRVKVINLEFEYLKTRLESYLSNEVESKIDLTSPSIITESKIYEQFKNNLKLEYKNYYFITFNYTSKILDKYIDLLNAEVNTERSNVHQPIHIHGKLNDSKNPIIFGYGDDNSKEYGDIQDAIDNDLLENFKTFQYLRTNNYQRILGLLESSELNVNIIGHSCALSDKTLLRTIFQHNNVKKIKAFYHSDESVYFENMYNISRIFDDNSLMRSKIVPLEKTEQL